MARAISVYCDRCGEDITLEPHQCINLGQGRRRDLCMSCFESISQKLYEIDRDILFTKDGRSKGE